MVGEAERYAEADRKRREQAEGLRRVLKEAGAVIYAQSPEAPKSGFYSEQRWPGAEGGSRDRAEASPHGRVVDADEKAIKDAFRKLALQYHPDRNKEPGGEEKLRYQRPVSCPTCHGSGAKPGTAPRKCDTCGGTGRRVDSRRQKGVMLQQITTCPACGGSGTFIEQRCPECKGSGQIVREETLTVKIPAGIGEGTALRVAGHGLPSDRAGGVAGDLFVVVRSLPHAHFERAGPDLWRMEIVEVAEAVLGATLQVPTLEGKPVEVTLTPGTQPDTVLRLRGKGLPEFGGPGRGDLLVRIKVRIPERPSADERRLYQQLRALGHPRKG